MNAQLKIVENLQRTEEIRAGAPTPRERRRSKRAMVAVRARICGGIGSLHGFEEVVTCIDISRDGVRLPTSRHGYFEGQMLSVTCPYWDGPTAINKARNAKVIRCTITPKLGYEIALQFLADEPEENHMLRRSAGVHAGQVRVLIVESDTRIGNAVRELLERDGYHVVNVEKPEHALGVIQTEAPHVIVAEAEGHEISGHDLCAIVKSSPRLQHIPVILLTSSALPSNYASSHLIGAIVCMSKTCKLEKIRQAVRLVAPPPSQSSAYSAAFNVAAFVRTS
jgi:CheY-like chemotaxis protein